MNRFFSEKGYVHFYASEPVFEDNEEGTPFTFNTVNKTFGRCELVFDSEKAEKISNEIALEIWEKSFWSEMQNAQY
ncbi:MAG: hypothetical protein VW879_01880 [Opitutae bacterium]